MLHGAAIKEKHNPWRYLQSRHMQGLLIAYSSTIVMEN